MWRQLMKLYPSKHRLYFRKQVTPEMIPLSYVYNDEKDWDIDIKIEPDFCAPTLKERVSPYQVFNTDKLFLFDTTGAPVSDITQYLQQTGARWRVLPAKVTDFVPKTFDFTVTVQRDAQHNKESTYRMNLGFMFTDTALRNTLFSLVQNPKQTKQYPSNIVINNGETMQEAFSNIAEKDCDFLFYTLAELRTKGLSQNIESAMSNHTNLWIIDDTFGSGFFEASDDESYGTYRLVYNDIYADDSGLLTDYKNSDDQYIRVQAGKRWSELDPDLYTPISFFKEGSPVQILHREGQGYIILSHSSFLSKINTKTEGQAQVRLFFEILSYVYLHSYFSCTKRDIFITDEPVDYYLNTTRQHRLYHPRINLDRILQTAGFNTQVPYKIYTVAITISDRETGNYTVSYTGVNRFNDLLFKKTAGKTKDPVKGNNVLIYTVNKTMLICDIKEISLDQIESGVSIRQVDAYTLAVAPMQSTKYRIYTTEEKFVSFNNAGAAAGDLVYTLFYDRAYNTNKAVTPFKMELSGQNTTKGDLVKIATITISVNMDMEYKDVRKLGGGEASTVPNYEMIDTGNRYGRPYRYGCPMLIELPARFQPMDEQIQSEVKKHIASGDYPIILYKD